MSSFRPLHTWVRPYITALETPLPLGSLFCWPHSFMSPCPFTNPLPLICSTLATTASFLLLEGFGFRHIPSSGSLQLVVLCLQIVICPILSPPPTLGSTVTLSKNLLLPYLNIAPLSIPCFISIHSIEIKILRDVLIANIWNNLLIDCIIWIPHTPSEYKL